MSTHGRTLREPIPVGPFLNWCDRYVAVLRAEHDAYPAINSLRGARAAQNPHAMSRPPEGDYVAQLIEAIGWTDKSGARRLHRWRHPEQDSKGYAHSGMVERAMIEEALERAGTPFYAVYPDEPDGSEMKADRFGVGRKMTDKQVVAAHTIYIGEGISTTELGGLLHERFGYKNQAIASIQVQRAFNALGLPMRRCVATNRNGRRCRQHPISHSELCCQHQRIRVPC